MREGMEHPDDVILRILSFNACHSVSASLLDISSREVLLFFFHVWSVTRLLERLVLIFWNGSVVILAANGKIAACFTLILIAFGCQILFDHIISEDQAVYGGLRLQLISTLLSEEGRRFAAARWLASRPTVFQE